MRIRRPPSWPKQSIDREANQSSMLDTIIFESIPAPGYLVMANSLTFSIGVSTRRPSLIEILTLTRTQAFGRAVGPFLISYCFSMSTQFPSDHPARQMVWVAFVILGLPSLWLAWGMRNLGRQGQIATDNRQGGDEEERVELMERHNA
jgi:uncharacterized membrane protein